MLSRGKARRTQIERNDRSIALRLFAYINIEWLNARNGKKTKREKEKKKKKEEGQRGRKQEEEEATGKK